MKDKIKEELEKEIEKLNRILYKLEAKLQQHIQTSKSKDKEFLEFLESWYSICQHKSDFIDDVIEKKIKELRK